MLLNHGNFQAFVKMMVFTKYAIVLKSPCHKVVKFTNTMELGMQLVVRLAS